MGNLLSSFAKTCWTDSQCSLALHLTAKQMLAANADDGSYSFFAAMMKPLRTAERAFAAEMSL